MEPFGTKISSVGNNVDATFQGYYTSSFSKTLVDIMLVKFRASNEIAYSILEFSGHIVWQEVIGTRVSRVTTPSSRTVDRAEGEKASIPPANGSSPFIDKVPSELRRAILGRSLPSRGQTIHPTCDDYIDLTSSPRQRTNRLVDMMLINKKMRDEITEFVYEERTFGVHVHQGFKNAGIEFLNVGRQPLQYLDHSGDLRFAKFRTGEMFGFCRLKKIEIHIFPSEDTQQHHHTATNTYLMNLALVRLLQRSPENEADRITSIRIIFEDPEPKRQTTGHQSIMAAENPWWDVDRDRPRETSIHSIPDIELVLRPFALLSRCHQVDIQLPAKLSAHVPTMNFVISLQRCMTGDALQDTLVSDDLDKKIESARYALEDFISKKLFGGHSAHALKNTDEEMEDAEQDPESDDDDGDADKDRNKFDDKNNRDDDSDDEDDDDGDDDMGRPGRQCSHEDLHDTKKHKANATTFSRLDGVTFDESGGFPEDPDIFDDDVHIAPDPTSQKIAALAECFEVTGDVARNYLRLAEGDLEHASELMSTPNRVDAEESLSRVREGSDGLAGLTEEQRNKLPHRRRGSGEQGQSSVPPTPPTPPPPPRKPKKGKQDNNNDKGKAVARDDDDRDMLDSLSALSGLSPSSDTSLSLQSAIAGSFQQPGANATLYESYPAPSPGPSGLNDTQGFMSANQLPRPIARPRRDPGTPTRRPSRAVPAQRDQHLYDRIAANNEVPESQFSPERARSSHSRPNVVVRRDSSTDLTMTYNEAADGTPTRVELRHEPSANTPSVNTTQTAPSMRSYSSYTAPGLLQNSSGNLYDASASSSSARPSDPFRFPGPRSQLSRAEEHFQQALLEQAQLQHSQTQLQHSQTQQMPPAQLQQTRSHQLQSQNSGFGSGAGFFARMHTRFPISRALSTPFSFPHVAGPSNNTTSTMTPAQRSNPALTTPNHPSSRSESDAQAMDVDSSGDSFEGGAPLDPEQTQDSGS